MATLNTKTIETLDSQDIEQIPNKQLVRNFGQDNDSIELKIFDRQGILLLTDKDFREYKTYNDAPGTKGTPRVTSIDIDYEQVLRDYGYNSGTYVLNFSFQRKLLENSKDAFTISEISPSRREIRITPNKINQVDFEIAISTLNNLLVTSPFVRDINLITPQTSTLILNALVSRDKTGLLKLYNPLPLSLSTGTSFSILEEIINPIEATVSLTTDDTEEVSIDIGPPNFTLSTEDIFTVPSSYKTFDQILNSGAVSSSFNQIQDFVSGSGAYIDLEFDNIDTPSGYHFENFIHFSSATERLQNFKYKLELLESYSGSLAKLDNITGGVANSQFVTENKQIYYDKQDKLIQGFDYYERYLYYESGAYAWPKEGSSPTRPFINVKTTSAAANSWFGVSIDNLGNYNGGQMVSASNFDNCNQYNLINTIPPHIRDNSQNDKYILFVEMIGQHFDGIWAYIDSITDINEAYSGLRDGISKDLVLNQLTSRGISAYDQFSNSSLYEYLIGDDGTGTYQFGTDDTATMISASNAGSIPKGDIAKEIWKRLYHNSSYLLKTKGTERGLKALIACYGIPETVLHVKEFGGPLVDKTGFRTFSYQKESRMLSPADDDYVISDTLISRQTSQTLQTRFLPTKGSTTAFDIMSFAGNSGNTNDIVIGISQSLDNTKLDSGSFAHLVIASGSLADSSAGRIKAISSSLLGPIFNGEVWNLSVILNSGSDRGNTIEAFATNTTFNKNTYILSCSLDTPEFFASGAGYPFYITTVGSTKPIGDNSQNGTLLAPFSGSIQEFRSWDEKLTKDTIVTQSLSPFNYNGNTISSSFEALRTRLSLGSCNRDLSLLTGSKNQAPNKTFTDIGNNLAQVPSTVTLTTIEETHHLTTPDTVGSGMVSDKIRIDNGTFDDNFLDPFISVETSPQDRQPLDYSDLGVYFSPTFEVNEDIVYTLGGFRLDDYIGDPKHYTSGSYPDLKTIRDIYTQKLNKKLGIGDYIRTIQFFDHTLFKIIKEFVPAKVNLKTGLVIEPHYLERAKIAGTNIDYEQLTEHIVAPTGMTGSLSSTHETIHDIVIDVPDYIISGSFSTATENVATTGRKSRYYSLS